MPEWDFNNPSTMEAWDLASGAYAEQVQNMLFLRGEKMKITGSMNYVKFDLENGYIIKAEGEMLVGRKFVVYTDTMKTWEPPHENEKLSKEQIEEIIREVQESMNENTVQIIFE